MADIIDISGRFDTGNNLVIERPLEFRRGDWRSGHAMLCTREESARYEAHRLEALGAKGHQHVAFVPSHFSLDGGTHYTAAGLFRHREDEGMMRRVYRLAGLMECVTNAPSAILRTDLLRRFYQEIIKEREELRVVWRGHVRHFLLPLHPDRRNPNLFNHAVAGASSLMELYQAIEAETNVQFDILSQFYVIYLPEGFLGRSPNSSES